VSLLKRSSKMLLWLFGRSQKTKLIVGLNWRLSEVRLKNAMYGDGVRRKHYISICQNRGNKF
jgi:hypothetical protein